MKMKMKISLVLSALLLGTSGFAEDGDGLPLVFSEPKTISNGGVISPDGHAFKTKVVQLGSGLLITTWGEGIGPDVYDLKGDEVRKARDIFVRTCMPSDDEFNKQCSLEDAWSPAVNISNTANKSSIDTRWQETDGVLNPVATPYYGDSGKPNIFNSGKYAVVTWVDKYCEGGDQRMISYNERGGITLPFQCVYASRIDYGTPGDVWKTEQITSGERDAMQDVNKGLSLLDSSGAPIGKWIITWQEDPHGLQIGGADGPGDGASGANVTHGTDIWYTWAWSLHEKGFNQPRTRITNNYTNDGAGGNTSPIFHPSAPDTEIITLESGNTGASRANAALVSQGLTAIPKVVIAYEETKGADRLDSGKFVRYHTFDINKAPVSQGQYMNGEPGYIISDPAENSRRVRFVTQVTPGAMGLRMGIFWRQGNAIEGGPGDIMVRLGYKDDTLPYSTGLRTADMRPRVAWNANAVDYTASTLINNVPALNISSNTVPWAPIGVEDAPSTNKRSDTTDLNAYEDARAHRAAIRGDDFYIGYTYARDWAVATFTDMDNYNFWFRRYSSATNSWTVAQNISNIPREAKQHVKEPRLVGMAGSRTGCVPGSVPEDERCQNKDAVLLGWGTETNVYAHIGGSSEGDIVYTISKDKGDTYLPVATVPGYVPGTMHRFESQLRATPAGNIIYSLWNEAHDDINASFSQVSVSDNRVLPAP